MSPTPKAFEGQAATTWTHDHPIPAPVGCVYYDPYPPRNLAKEQRRSRKAAEHQNRKKGYLL